VRADRDRLGRLPRPGVRIVLPSAPATYRFYDFFTFTAATDGTVVVRSD
jgi:hypothetical protein